MKDEYTKVVLGQLGVGTRGGIQYVVDESLHKAIAEINRRPQTLGMAIQAEFGSLTYSELQKMDQRDRVLRFASIDPEMVCAEISNVHIRYDGEFPMLFGNVKLTGPYSEMAKSLLSGPEPEAQFTMRSFIKHHKDSEPRKASVDRIITWDLTPKL